MASGRKGWQSLSPGYRSRLERKGITKAQYESGVNLSAARGHAKTPEHGLKSAFSNPKKYENYLQTRLAKTRPPGKRPEDALDEALRINEMLDKAFRNIHERLSNYAKYGEDTVRANVYGGVTRESGAVPGMSYAQALWTSTADTEELRSFASEQYRTNPWWYHA